MTFDGQPDLRPAHVLPRLYFATGYIGLFHAFLAAWLAPGSLIGFFYHSRLIAAVHLVTLGWITSVIIGVLFIIVPSALSVPLRPKRSDYWGYALYVIGVIGMAAHFWIGEFGGMAWSAIMVAVAIVHVGVRIVPRVLRSQAGRAIKLHLTLAFANIVLAATAGVVLGFDKVHHFLPGYVIWNVLAHAHLAALGWASIMVFGLAYRVFPEMFERATPRGRASALSAILLQVAALGLFGSLLVGSRWAALFAACGGWAVVRFGLWLFSARRSGADGANRTVAVAHLLQACGYGAVTAAIGVALAWLTPSELTLRLALVYGVCGLIGFLTQALLGIQIALMSAAALRDPMPRLVYGLWTIAIPGITAGFFFDTPRLLSSAAWIACLATTLTAAQMLGPAPARSVSWARDRLARRRHSHKLGVPKARA